MYNPSFYYTAKAFREARWGWKNKTSKDLISYQLAKIISHTNFLRHHSTYFANQQEISSFQDFSHWPTMDKNTMMNNFNALNTAHLDRDHALDIAISSEKDRNFCSTYNGYSVGLSSGTSGHRGLFVLSKKEQALWAGNVLAKYLPNHNLRGHRIAFFLRANSSLYESTDSVFLSFSYFDLYRPLKDLVDDLIAYKPTVLVAPPSVLLRIIDFAHKYIGENKPINPSKIITVAEVLNENDEQRFRNIFQLEIIHQAYQATEGFIAFTCKKGSLHLNEDLIMVEREYLDKSRFIPIITDFRRTTQPIVRYRLNDVLVDSHNSESTCTCEYPFSTISHIEGREDDIFLFEPADNNTVGQIQVFPDLISRCVLYTPGIRNYKIVQNQHGITVYVDPLNNNIIRGITNELAHLSNQLVFVLGSISFKSYRCNKLYNKDKRIERIST